MTKILVGTLVFLMCPLTLCAQEATGAAREIPPAPRKMAPDANPSFEVATIKPSDPQAQHRSFGKNGRTFRTHNVSLSELIRYAYDVHAKQILNEPAWFHENKFDIAAVPDQEGEPSDRQWKTMLKQLLADRFQLAFHRDKSVLSVYVLSVGKGGPKNLTKSESTATDFNLSIDPVPGGLGMSAQNATMTNFAVFGLQGAVLDRPVLDQTGLAGRFDFVLKWMPDESQTAGLAVAQSDAPQAGLFTAIREQLGLKLEAAKAPADVLIIDHAQPPSTN